MSFGKSLLRVLARSAWATRTALTSARAKRVAMLAPLVAVAVTAGRSWHRRRAALASAPGPSTTHSLILVVVARHRPDLYATLSEACWGSTDIRIVLDRRGADPLTTAWRGPERRSAVANGERWATSGVKVILLPGWRNKREEPEPRTSNPPTGS